MPRGVGDRGAQSSRASQTHAQVEAERAVLAQLGMQEADWCRAMTGVVCCCRRGSTVKESELVEFRNKLAKSATPRQAKNLLNIIRPAFKWAVQHRGLLTVSPAANLGGNVFAEEEDDAQANACGIWDASGKIKNEPPKILTREERRAVLRWLKKHSKFWYLFYRLMLATGASERAGCGGILRVPARRREPRHSHPRRHLEGPKGESPRQGQEQRHGR